MAVTHAKVSEKTDGSDATMVRASDWNASHTVSITHTELNGIGIDQHHAKVHALEGPEHSGSSIVSWGKWQDF